MRAAAALFPPLALPAVQRQLIDAVEAKLNDDRTAGHPIALTVAHAMSELLSVCPSQVNRSAGRLVDFAIREMFPTGVERMAIDHCSAFLNAEPAVCFP